MDVIGAAAAIEDVVIVVLVVVGVLLRGAVEDVGTRIGIVNMIDNMIDEESRLSGYSYYLHYPYYCYYHCLGYLAVKAVKVNSGFVKQVLIAATAAAVDKAVEVRLSC